VKKYRKEGYSKAEAEYLAANNPRHRVDMPVKFEKYNNTMSIFQNTAALFSKDRSVSEKAYINYQTF